MIIRFRWMSYAIVGLACAAAATLALVGLSVLVPPPNLSEPSQARKAAITASEFRDERTVAAEVDALQPVAAALRLSGIITFTSCVPGGELMTGRIVASVSGRPILGLYTAVPFFRDIGPGAKGPDVDALRVSLAAMGHSVAEAGVYSADLRVAIIKLQTDFALHQQDGVLHLEDFVWLPEGHARARTCDALLGAQYVAGTPFFTTVGKLRSVRVVFPPGQPPAPGERHVFFGEASAPMKSDGLVTEPSFLEAVSKSPEFASAQSSSSPKPLSVKTRLGVPVEVAKIPISGVFGLSGSSACVKSQDGVTHPLNIIGSSLGAVLATFDTGIPQYILLGQSIGAAECQRTTSPATK